MRTVEAKMIEAIRAGKSARLSNTRVESLASGAWRVFLHGNLIANGGTTSMHFTLAGWGTPTTRSRVNALLAVFAVGGARVSQRGGVQQFSQSGTDRAITSQEWIAPACVFTDRVAA